MTTDVTRPRAPTGLVVAAFAMTFSSAFGQTYFIAVFGGELKATLGLTDGELGGLYTLATLASAVVLVWAGKVADYFRIRWLAVAVLIGLALACVAMANVTQAWMLLPVFFALRFFGQGSLGHLATTGVGRWYVRRRGRMMSLAILGFPATEALMPVAAVFLTSIIGWRQTWLLGAVLLILISAPVVRFFLRREPAFDQSAEAPDPNAPVRRQWTRAEVLRLPQYYAVLWGIMVPAFILTGIFFHQVPLIEAKGWTHQWFVGWLPAYAALTVSTALATGIMIDKIGARQILPYYLLPLAAGTSVLAFSSSPLAVPGFFFLSGFSLGSGSTLLGALWVELFGTRHLGAIRSIAVAAQVVASAAAPGLIGFLLDLGVPLSQQFIGLVIYALVSSIWMAIALPRLHRIAIA